MTIIESDNNKNPDEPLIVGLSGSRRSGSYTRRALNLTLEECRSLGAEVELLDLAELDLPTLDPDKPDVGDSQILRERMLAADCIILATPMYHGSFSGVVKNAIDYCGFDEFEDTTVGLLGIAGGRFPIAALNQLRLICRSLNAWVLPVDAAIPNAHDQFEGDDLTNDELRSQLQSLSELLVAHSEIIPKSIPQNNPPQV